MTDQEAYRLAKLKQRLDRRIAKNRKTVYRGVVDGGCVLLTTKLWQHRGRVERGEIDISDPATRPADHASAQQMLAVNDR